LKSNKSLQNRLNEFFDFTESETVSASAFSQARFKLSHRLFIDLNRVSYAEEYYTGEHKRYGDYRLLAIDGSKLRLPESKEIRKEFGTFNIKNQTETGSYAAALCSVYYDVLNENVIDSKIAQARSSEHALAQAHIEGFCKDKDLVLLDRGYSGYELFSSILSNGGDFVCRCSSNAFSLVEDFILESQEIDKEITLRPCRDLNSKVNKGLLPSELNLRLVKVELSSGETEVLITSLVDSNRHPTQEFEELYFMRWGVEVYYDRLKNRLELENFTGKSVESVNQDFYSTILVANTESELTEDANEELSKKKGNKNAQKVNKAVSYNVIKHHVLLLLIGSDADLEDLQEQLSELFKMTPVPIRAGRSFPRKTTPRRQVNHLKRIKKSAY